MGDLDGGVREHGVPERGRRPLAIAVEPTYVPTPQPVPITVGGRAV